MSVLTLSILTLSTYLFIVEVGIAKLSIVNDELETVKNVKVICHIGKSTSVAACRLQLFQSILQVTSIGEVCIEEQGGVANVACLPTGSRFTGSRSTGSRWQAKTLLVTTADFITILVKVLGTCVDVVLSHQKGKAVDVPWVATEALSLERLVVDEGD